MNKRFILPSFFLALLLYLLSFHSYATDTSVVKNASVATDTQPVNAENKSVDDSLSDEPDPARKVQIVYSEDSTAMLRSIQAMKRRLEYNAKNGDPDYDEHRQDLLEQEILLVELNDSEFDRAGVLPPQDKKFDWRDNVNTILQPIFSTLNALTSKPRETAKNEAELNYIKNRIESFKHGVVILEQLKEKYTDKPKELKTINMVLHYWQAKLSEAEKNKVKLNDRLAALDREKPLSEQINHNIANSFTNKIITIFYCLIAALISYTFFNVLSLKFNHYESKLHRNQFKLAHRLGYFALRILGSISAIASVFFVIYLRADWVLLGLGFLAFFVMLIGLKDTIPKYLIEIRTLLNLGSVREGERIVLNGVAWRIDKLSIYCTLNNPDLSCTIHIALSSLADLSSRPYDANEPFFPTRINDWVYLSDGTFGQVISQSPENVVLSSLMNVVTIPTSSFLALNPRNYSKESFILTSVFGIDYEHQGIATTQAPKLLEEYLNQAPLPEGLDGLIENISVEFSLANASSLDFKIIVVAKAAAAPNKFGIERWLQKASVDAANQYNWGIPFQQLTLHKA